MNLSPSDPLFWQKKYEAGDRPWDKGSPAPALLDFLSQQQIKGDVLVPGCGSGHDVRALAQQGASVIGMDFAPAAIAWASSFPFAGNEKYELANFLDLPTKWHARFDWIVEHTCFCAISPDRRPDYVQSCLRALRPGGKLLAIFYLKTGLPPDEGPPYSANLDEINTRFAPFFECEKSYVPSQFYPGRENSELLWLGRLRPVLPSDC